MKMGTDLKCPLYDPNLIAFVKMGPFVMMGIDDSNLFAAVQVDPLVMKGNWFKKSPVWLMGLNTCNSDAELCGD